MVHPCAPPDSKNPNVSRKSFVFFNSNYFALEIKLKGKIMNILQELYYGNIGEFNRRTKPKIETMSKNKHKIFSFLNIFLNKFFNFIKRDFVVIYATII